MAGLRSPPHNGPYPQVLVRYHSSRSQAGGPFSIVRRVHISVCALSLYKCVVDTAKFEAMDAS